MAAAASNGSSFCGEISNPSKTDLSRKGNAIMKLFAIDHITINCRDIKKACSFYETVLKLPKLNTVDMGDHMLYYYQLPGVKLELIEYKEPQKNWETGNTDTGIYRHFAIMTDNLEEIRESCLAAGGKINMEPTFIPQLGNTVMLIGDPNGVEIELILAK